MDRLSYLRKVGAGRTADQKYQRRLRAWRQRVRKVVLVAAAAIAVIEVMATILWPAHATFLLGLALGAAVSFYVVTLQSPPEHIDRWRRGRDGERRTEKALRPLARQGWMVVHDLDGDYGNIDHVLVGPCGVFMLDSKNLGGNATVDEDGVLHVRWLEDPEDGYEVRGISRRMRGCAAEVQRRLDGAVRWVTPVVVIWGRFEQGIVEAEGVAFVRGEELAEWLVGRPDRLTEHAHERAAAAITLARESGRPDRASRKGIGVAPS